MTLADLQERLEKEKQIWVSLATLWREPRGLNLRRKKNLWQPVKETNESEPGIDNSIKIQRAIKRALIEIKNSLNSL